MASFGKQSKRILKNLHPKLQDVLLQTIHFYDFKIISGVRGEVEQNQLYRSGLSKKQYPNSKHNTDPAIAVDIAPYPVDWDDTERFYFLAGIVRAASHQMGITLRWGGDWDSDDDLHDQTFMDLGHFELEG